MARFFRIILTVALIATCTAQGLRFRPNRFFARQEVAVAVASSDAAPPAKAPYPPAGIKPDIPFDLPTETTTAQPDNTYLPPDNNVPASTYLPPTTTAVPEDGTEVPEVDDDDTVISVAVSYDTDTDPQLPQRLVFGQRTQPLNGKSQRLRAIKAQPIFIDDDGSFAYSAQVQNW